MVAEMRSADITDDDGIEVPSSSLPLAAPSCVDLAAFTNSGYNPGRRWPIRAIWHYLSLLVFENGLFPLSAPKAFLLRRFGARVGRGVIIKPHVRIKYPWRLTVGDHCWIGQGVWIDNLADVQIGNHVCISQGAYLCTGSHDYRRRTFDLITRPITLADGVWIGAKAILLPGVCVGTGAVVGAGSTVTKTVAPGVIVAGTAARPTGQDRSADENVKQESG
jgi:putative colanic acid biosynthesis acetyltransferase WcaF